MVGVMILNRNGKNWVSGLCDSLRRARFAGLRVYLVDNASDDDSVAMTTARYPEVKVIRMPRNLGYCMAYNLAMPIAFADGCEWVIWANNDVLLEGGCLEELARCFQSDPRIGVAGPSFLAWDKDEPNYYMLGNHPQAIPAMQARRPTPVDVEWVEGSFLMVSRKCVEAVGPLDPYLFFYWEETDFCRRARHLGWRVVLAPSAVARHYAGGWSDGNAANKASANRLQSRNYYIYQLANPGQSFIVNLWDALHLFAVQVKAGLRGDRLSGRREIGAYGEVMSELGTVYRKWRKDRAGEHPPLTTPEYRGVQPEVLGADG